MFYKVFNWMVSYIMEDISYFIILINTIIITYPYIYNLMIRGLGVMFGGWPQSLTCSEVKHRPTFLVPEWVMTRVFIDKSSLPHTHVYRILITQPTVNLKNINGHIFRCLRSIKKNFMIGYRLSNK